MIYCRMWKNTWTESSVPAEPTISAVLQRIIADLSPALRAQLAKLLAEPAIGSELELPEAFEIPWGVPIAFLDECFPYIDITNDDLQEFNPHYADLSDSDLELIGRMVRLHWLYDWLWPEICSAIDNNSWPAT